MVDLKRQYRELKSEIDAAVLSVLESSRFILGPNVAALEEEIAAFHGVSRAVGVASGTDALLLALRACGVGPGDEVITTPFTFIATAEVVSLLHATVVFADIRPDTFNIDAHQIEKKITAKTKAIIPVHLFGHPAEMDEICALARKHGLKVIEDCAQSFGSEYHDKKTGTLGDCGCFSFFPSKNLAGCGDGGMVITSDAQMADTINLLRDHGSDKKYYHSVAGYNSRLDEIQAAIIRVKLKRISGMNEARRSHALTYRASISRTDVALPVELPGCRHVYHQFSIRTPKRDAIMKALRDNEIASAIYYPLPLHRQVAFAGQAREGDTFPVSEAAAVEILSLPMFPELTGKEIKRIADVINYAR
jgi:dTDP-4-amino-4,6-dideoxygalactose transaminase